MSPIRIFILAVLFYILYRLLFGKKKAKKKQSTVTDSPGDSTSQDVLVEDPVCHTYVPKKQAIAAIKNGEKYYFCSDKCCQTFLTENDHDPKTGHKKEGED